MNSYKNFNLTVHPKAAIYAYTNELLLYLHLLDTHPIIREFLQYDCCFRLADKYLIAMVFVYFKRARLGYNDYTYLNFFAALCLAHSMEEEDEELCNEIYPWALGGIDHPKELVPQLLELKVHLWQAMDFRAAVMSIASYHPVWQRERTLTHAGAPREYTRRQSAPKTPDLRYDLLTNTCAKCRTEYLKSGSSADGSEV